MEENLNMSEHDEAAELSYTEISSQIGKLLKRENKPIAFDTLYEQLCAPLNTLTYVLDKLKRANLVAEEHVEGVSFIYPLAPLFGTSLFYAKAELISLHLKVAQQRRNSATSEQLHRIEQLQRAAQTKGALAPGSSSKSCGALEKEAQQIIESILDIAKAVATEVGATTDTVLKGLGVQDMTLYRLGITSEPPVDAEAIV